GQPRRCNRLDRPHPRRWIAAMAKAKRKSTPSKNARAADAAHKSGWFRPSAKDWADAEQRLRDAGWLPPAEYLANADKARKELDRALAIEAGFIAPPWMKKPRHSPKAPKKKKNTLHQRLVELMRELQLEPGKQPREVRGAVNKPYK